MKLKQIEKIYNVISASSAASVVGLPITFLIMNGQLIFGNLMGSKLIPKLSLPKIIIVFILDLLFLFALLALAVMIYFMVNPVKGFKELFVG